MHTKHVQRQRIVLVEATAAYFSEQGIGSSSSHPMACRVVATGMFALLANSVSSSGQSITPDTIHSRQDVKARVRTRVRARARAEAEAWVGWGWARVRMLHTTDRVPCPAMMMGF